MKRNQVPGEWALDPCSPSAREAAAAGRSILTWASKA